MATEKDYSEIIDPIMKILDGKSSEEATSILRRCIHLVEDRANRKELMEMCDAKIKLGKELSLVELK